MIGMGFLGLKYKLNDEALHISCLKLFISEDITVKLCNFNLLLLKFNTRSKIHCCSKLEFKP